MIELQNTLVDLMRIRQDFNTEMIVNFNEDCNDQASHILSKLDMAVQCITEAEELMNMMDTDDCILESGSNPKNEIKEKFRGVIKSYSSYMKKMKSLLDNGKADDAIKMISTGSSAGTGRQLIQQIADDLYISLVPVAINVTERMLKIAEPFCKKYKIAKSNRYTHDCNWCRNEYKKAKGIKDGDSAADRVLSSMFAELEAMMASLVDLETDMLHIADAINRENK